MAKNFIKEIMIRFNFLTSFINLAAVDLKILQILRNSDHTPLFSKKIKTANIIILHESNRIIKDNKKTSHTLNKYKFDEISEIKKKTISAALKKTPLKHLLKRFKNQSINKIQEHFPSKEKFTLRDFQQDEIIKVMKELPKNKASTFKDIAQLKS